MVSISAHDELAEFLIGPKNERTKRLLDLFVRRLRNRGLSGEPIFFESSDSTGVIIGKTYVGESPARGGNFQFTEDQWPEALGFRLVCDANSIAVEGDHFSLRPLYWANSPEGDFVGTSLQWIGAAVGSSIDPMNAVEMTLLSFNLDVHTPLRDVNRMLARQIWTKRTGKPSRIEVHSDSMSSTVPALRDCTGPEARELISGVADRIAGMMSGDCALELTGGKDSRCVLALGRWRDARPKFAFTIGREEDEDVRIARRLCEATDIQHHRVDPEFELGNLEEDTRDYLESACFQVNATSNCWMPSLFRHLASERDSQICGQMAQSGFYYTPIDLLGSSGPGFRLWFDKRLMMSGGRAAGIFGGELYAAGLESARNTAAELISSAGGGFREATDQFYLWQRVRQWSAATTHAGRYWYRSYVPLLDHRMGEWARRCSSRDKRMRVNQMRICHDLGSEISGIPFNDDVQCPVTEFDRLRERVTESGRVFRSVRRRLTRKRRSPDLKADDTARRMLASSSFNATVLEMIGELGIRDPERVMKRIEMEVESCQREVGFLVTLSLLRESVISITSDLGRSASEPL